MMFSFDLKKAFFSVLLGNFAVCSAYPSNNNVIVSDSSVLNVELFAKEHFTGYSEIINLTTCRQVPSYFWLWQRFAIGSVETSGCVILYREGCCQGIGQRMDHGSTVLPTWMKSGVKSLQPCHLEQEALFDRPFLKKIRHNNNPYYLSKMYDDGNVAIYYENLKGVNASKIGNEKLVSLQAKYLKELWAHVKQTFGEFGSEGKGRISFSGFHTQNIIDYRVKHPSRSYATHTYPDEDALCYNEVNFGLGSPNDLGNEEAITSEQLDTAAAGVARIVEDSFSGMWGSPTWDIWGDSFKDIFTYDAYLQLGYHTEAERLLEQFGVGASTENPEMDMSTSEPELELLEENEMNATEIIETEASVIKKSKMSWFADWSYPLYQKYGMAVFQRYFQLLAVYLPKSENGLRYSRGRCLDMNLGQFVHFWSGAAGEDLSDFAREALQPLWTESEESQLKNARKIYRTVHYQTQTSIK